MEFAQKEFSKSMPSVAIRSILGVGAILSKRPPGYAEIALQAWSSENMKTMLGLRADTACGRRKVPMKSEQRRRLIMVRSSRADLEDLDKHGRTRRREWEERSSDFKGCVLTRCPWDPILRIMGVVIRSVYFSTGGNVLAVCGTII